MSVNPFRWFDRAQTSAAQLAAYAGHADASFADDTTSLQRLSAPGLREIRLSWVGGRPLAVSTTAEHARRVYDGRTGESLAPAQDEIVAAARKLLPDATLADVALLTEEDAYWYSHHNERSLPVLRLKFDDAAATWIHIDPATGEVLGRVDASGRLYRWLFNALHDFDLRVLLQHRPARDLVVWLLSVGGMIVSVSGVVIGWRRLGRTLAR